MNAYLIRWHTKRYNSLTPNNYTHAREYVSSTKLEQPLPRLEKYIASLKDRISLHCNLTTVEFETIPNELSFAKVYVE